MPPLISMKVKNDCMDKDLRAFYEAQLERYTLRLQALRRQGRVWVTVQLATFIAALGCLVLSTTVASGMSLWIGLAVLMLAGYLWARRKDGQGSDLMEQTQNVCSVYSKELKALDGDFSGLDDGGRYVNPQHEYTYDMDIFGAQSLYNRMARCVTTGGADRLADCLSHCALGPVKDCAAGESSPVPTAESLEARRTAILELARQEAWRTRWMSHGQRDRIRTADILKALEAMRTTQIPSWPLSPVVCGLAWAGCVGFWVSVVLAFLTPLSSQVPVWWATIQFFCVYLLCSKPLRLASKGVGRLHSQLKQYVRLMRLMVQLQPEARLNRQLVEVLDNPDTGALRSLVALEKIIDGLDRRGNVLGMMLFDALLLSDYFLARRFLYWQRRYISDVAQWIATVSEMDARVSMATFCYNHPEAREPEVVEADRVVFEAEGLTHPFLGRQAVPNDFVVTDRHYYIVTGANMAGKSTFLRSLGVNYILAMAGMPVFARRMRVSVFSLFSSMRTSDDLAHGISYFNAELLRLRQLIESCKHHCRTLIILDEILKGTNSLDKLNGSRMFLEAISSLPVTGVIATHDLELSKMADHRPDRFHNYCFEIKLADKITYTYKITPGVARNQNATYLLQQIIRDI